MAVRKIRKLPRGQRREPPAKPRPKPQERRSSPSPGREPHPPAERPRAFNAALAEVLCERIANGQTTSDVLRDPAMPSWSTLYRWRDEHPDFNRAYTIARQACCEKWADEIIDISDNATNDYMQRSDGKRVFDRESFERSRLRADNRKWVACKVLRHVYGEKSEVDLRAPDGISLELSAKRELIEAIMLLVRPKDDPDSKPHREEEDRER